MDPNKGSAQSKGVNISRITMTSPSIPMPNGPNIVVEHAAQLEPKQATATEEAIDDDDEAPPEPEKAPKKKKKKSKSKKNKAVCTSCLISQQSRVSIRTLIEI